MKRQLCFGFALLSIANTAMSQELEVPLYLNNEVQVIDGLSNPSVYEEIAKNETKTVIFKNSHANGLEVYPQVEKSIAELANPHVVLVEPGKSIREAVLAQCHGAGVDYEQILEKNVVIVSRKSEATPIRIHDPVNFPLLVLAPECIGRTFRSVVVEPNDSLWTIHKKQFPEGYGIGPDGGWSDFQKDFSSINDLSLDDKIDVGDSYLIAPNYITITAPNERAHLLAEEIGEVYGEDAVTVTDGVSSYGRAQSLGDVSESCEPGNLNNIIDYNVPVYESVLSAFIINKSEKKRREILDAPVHVAVLDTGITPTSHPLVKSFAHAITSAYGDKRADFPDPKNKIYAFKNFIDGENEPFLGSGHAEAVIGATLGGFFGSFYNSLNQTIVIHSHNIYDYSTLFSAGNSVMGAVSILPLREHYKQAVTSINTGSSDVSIINVSQSWTSDDPTESLKSFVADGRALIVAASGNSDNKVDAGDTNYPAIYGGEEDSSIIVVSALNSKYEILEGSSYHRDLVDIGALGCNVPTIVYRDGSEDMTMGFESGSSLAAPNVTFAAAIVKYLHGGSVDAKELKKRLIFSADIVPELSEKIKDGRVLNIEKALNIYFDVVDLINSDYLQRGKVMISGFDDGQVEICSGEMVDVREVKKIARVVEDDVVNFYVYVNLSGENFKKILCDTMLPLEIEHPDGSLQSIDLEDLEDVVFRMKQ